MPTVHVATAAGVHAWDDAGMREVSFPDRAVTAIARAGDGMWAIVEQRELWRSVDGAWEHVADLEGPPARCVASVGGEVLVGTAEAHLFRLEGDALRRVEAFDSVVGRGDWYTPWGGPPDTRSITNWDDDVYVNVHVGGIPRTSDGGETWTPTIEIDADVHQVTTAEGYVFAACAGGLAASTDRGARWSLRTEGLAATYCRAVAVLGEEIFVTSSNGPRGGRAALSRAPFTGGAFERVDVGPGWFDGNIDSAWLDALPQGSLIAFGTADGRLFVSTDGGASWDERATGLPQVRRVLVMP